jgi:hypothetical protein
LVMGLSWGYAACSYSLIKPPRTGWRVIRLSLRSETGGLVGEGGAGDCGGVVDRCSVGRAPSTWEAAWRLG